jgi:uncharacterized OB-fold protein
VSATTSLDWTRGGDRLVYFQCGGCGHRFYFRRGFCPACGAASPAARVSKGRGIVHASTLVHRAPSDAFRAIAPYRIVLVDLAEGLRVMAHGQASLAIADPVVGRIEIIAGRALPYFTALPDEDSHAAP